MAESKTSANGISWRGWIDDWAARIRVEMATAANTNAAHTREPDPLES
jgi:hypothetical protein